MTRANDPAITPGDTIGILGSGQLGRMLALAAARLGIKTHIFCPDSGPAFDTATHRTLAAYEDEKALAAFASSVRVVTYEFENVPSHTAEFLAGHVPVHPNPRALATTQDRLSEKRFLNGLGIPTAPYLDVEEAGGVMGAVTQIGHPAILKTRRFGYDGKGQFMIREATDLAAISRVLGDRPAIVEGVVPFAREVSVVAARSADGSFAAYALNENDHLDQILSVTRAPAEVNDATASEAVSMANRIADALHYVGVLAVEMFLVEADGPEGRLQSLVVNEIAPRVHNSGHWTLDGATTSQFEQHVRAICGWPLGSTAMHGPVEMRNLIGPEVHAWRDLLAEPGACVHLYGKNDARPGRKMGHVTRLLPGKPE